MVADWQDFLSQEDIAVYQGVFELFDTQKRGVIDAESLKQGMLAMKMHPKDSEIRDMIKEGDKAKTGSIDFRAFVDVITGKIGKLDGESEILKAFNTFDKKDTGEVTVDELRRALCTMGDALSDKEFRDVVRLGGDADGNFDYEKFTKLMVGTRKSADDDE